MIEKIGKVVYRLKLHVDSKIHPVFHISQLKPVLGNHHQVYQLPQDLTDVDEVVIQPQDIKDNRYNSEGDSEALVVWTGLPTHKQSWEKVKDLKHQFPDYKLEGKLVSSEGGIDGPLKVYTKREKKSC